ncbi:MAG TPA: hypothetical protein VHG08_07160 [Longimicrobium sp.]|nr:hypothetical protein [Longimicrobium sp.]
MRNLLSVSGGVGLVLLIAVLQIHTSQQSSGGLISGQVFAQELRRPLTDDPEGSPDVEALLRQLQDSAFVTTFVPNRPRQ